MPLPLMPGQSVPGHEGFAAFVAQLSEEYRQRGNEWENATLERFLEALSAWVETGPGWYERHRGEALPSDGNWT